MTLIHLAEDSGGYTTFWYCTPPPLGMQFVVDEETWHGDGDRPVRSVYRWHAAHPERLESNDGWITRPDYT